MVIRGWWHAILWRSQIGWIIMCSLNGTCTVSRMGRRIIHIDDVTLPCHHLARGWFLSNGGHLVVGDGQWVVAGRWLLVAQRLERLVVMVGDRRGGDETEGVPYCCLLLCAAAFGKL